MDPAPTLPPSFSRGRKWSLSLNLLVMGVALAAVVAMVNYLAARHHRRWAWSVTAQGDLSPLTQKVLSAVTNQVKVTLYFQKEDPLFELSWSLLKTYRYANARIQVEAVDYETEPGLAEVVKTRYKLGRSDRDMVIFDCPGKGYRVVNHGELSVLDMQGLMSGKSSEVRRTHFKGEAMFTSAILSVISPRSPKAYFLEGHAEHNPESDDAQMGYSRLGGVMRESNIQFERLNLAGPGDVPPDCSLLIVAGPRTPLQPEVLEKIERYLQKGGRLLALLLNPVLSPRPSGLESVLSKWGVTVGSDVVRDDKHSVSANLSDLVTSTFSSHPLIRPLYYSQLYLLYPRSVRKSDNAPTGPGAPQVDALAFTGPEGRVVTDLRPGGIINPTEGDFRGQVPLMVAVERGGIRNVSADLGAARLVVAGDSLFLSNNNLDREGNREFASYAMNWLLARDEMLVNVPPRPISEYKLTMTSSQLTAARWILMGALPGSALALGMLVWLRRRR